MSNQFSGWGKLLLMTNYIQTVILPNSFFSLKWLLTIQHIEKGILNWLFYWTQVVNDQGPILRNWFLVMKILNTAITFDDNSIIFDHQWNTSLCWKVINFISFKTRHSSYRLSMSFIQWTLLSNLMKIHIDLICQNCQRISPCNKRMTPSASFPLLVIIFDIPLSTGKPNKVNPFFWLASQEEYSLIFK